jgi:hypothetical protein
MAFAVLLASGDGPRDANQLERKPMKLETIIRILIEQSKPTPNESFDIIAHELIHDGEFYSTNTSWYLRRDADIPAVLEAARGRWEVFKVNYAPRARVSDIRDIGYDADLSLEVEGIPFLEIRPSRN